MRDVKRALATSGLEVFDSYSSYLRPEMDWDLILPALDFGGELGAKYLLVIAADPEWGRMCDERIRGSVAAQSSRGVRGHEAK